jgi:hypothetical protein
MVFASFQHGLGLPVCDFLCGLLDHYQMKLIHLNPNSILQITIFVHQPSIANRKVAGGVGLQTRPHTSFLDLPLKTSLWRWHETWFYCENHEPNLPPFVGQLFEFNGTWSEEPTPLELPQVATLTIKINLLKGKGLTRVCVAAIVSYPSFENETEVSIHVPMKFKSHDSNNMINRYNISLNYKLKSYKMTFGSKRNITE